MNDFMEKLHGLHWAIVIIIGILLVLFLGATDYLTGPELSFSIFYLIPISIVTLMSGRGIGFILSSICAAVWFFTDIKSDHQYTHRLIHYWNAIVRLGYFTIHTFLLSILLKLFQEEKMKSLLDPLTNAANWRYFEEYSHRELQRIRRAKKAVTLVYFDLDNFKEINESLGHDVGDDLLRTVSEIIQGNLRPSDMLARVGGDEFVILLSETDFNGTEIVLTRIRESVLSEMKNHGWNITLSIGAITYGVVPSSIESMVKQADRLMYSVKKNGKNNLKHESWPPVQTAS